MGDSWMRSGFILRPDRPFHQHYY